MLKVEEFCISKTATVLETLKKLDETERCIVILHAVSGMKHREIASELDMALATVLSKYARAIKKLKKHIEGGGTNE